MDTTFRFTKQSIEKLTPAESGKRAYYADKRYKYLRLAVTEKGAKSWVLQRRINGRVSRITLGRFPDLTPENAIKGLEKTMGRIANGEDPRTTELSRDSRKLTLGDAFEVMLKVRQLKASTTTGYRNLIYKGALHDWANKPLVSITPDVVAERHAYLIKNSGGAYANVAMRTLRAIWNFVAAQYEDAQGASLLPPNPVTRLSKTKAWVRLERRKSYIQLHQLPAWFEAVDRLRAEPWGSSAQTVGDYLMLLLLTGLRRNEGAQLKWTQVDFKVQTLRIGDTKNHDEHLLPLTDYLLELLKQRRLETTDSPFVFPSGNSQGHLSEPRTYLERVIRESGVTFMLHDLRRTFATVVESMDLSHYTLKKLMNHRMTGDVTAGYIGNNVERLREPMQHITNVLITAGNNRHSEKVVHLRDLGANALKLHTS
jgi:integrase